MTCGPAAGVLPDVGDGVNQETQLRAGEELFRLAFEQAPAGMTLTRLDAEGHRIIERANAVIAAILGEPIPSG